MSRGLLYTLSCFHCIYRFFQVLWLKAWKTAHLTKVKNRFKFLGKFMAKACMDSRIIDIPFSLTFYKWMLGQETSITISDLEYVDPALHKSLSQLYEVVLKKKQIESDCTHSPESLHLALSSLTLDGLPIEDLGLDFVLPGTNIDLKKNGKDIIVSIENLEEYLKVSSPKSLRFVLCNN